MTARAHTRLLAIPPSALTDRPAATLADVESTLEPDTVWVLGPSSDPQAFATARRAFDVEIIHPPLESGDLFESRSIGTGGLEVAIARGVVALRAEPDEIRNALLEGDSVAVVCEDVTTTVDPTILETHLESADILAGAFPAGRTTTLLTPGEPAGYDELWHLEADTGRVLEVDHEPAIRPDAVTSDERVSVRLRGVGPTEGYNSRSSVALVTLTDAGVDRIETYSVSDFGLEAISGVGPKTAARLADREITSRQALLEMPLESLAELPGVGRDRAQTIHTHARVLETGRPRRLTDDPLPGEQWSTPPLSIDIETDGLSPTIIWQIGVYDPETDEYRAFVERDDPTDPASVIEAFCDWLLGVHPDRALLTWNGWRFDYRHLGAFIARHVPFYAAAFEDVPKFDLYGWAVRNENAIVPGRTNQLADVATALGYDGMGTGLDGATTAAAYGRFMRTGDALEWDRHEAYCEDDCRALWYVYEQLLDAPRAAIGATERCEDSSGRLKTSDESPSKQTGLGDF